jgi:hypothetical protein
MLAAGMRALLAVALVLAAAAAGEARAQAKRDVAVESDPPGADVYLNSKDDGSLCKTPCTIKAPIGEAIVIVEVANHVSGLESLIVPRRGKTPTLKFKLQRAVGTVIVKGPAGAKIRIGDADKGKAPAKLEIDAGPHSMTLTLNGKQVLADVIEVEAGGEVVVQGKAVAQAAPVEDEPEVIETDDPEPGAGGGGGGGGGEVTKAMPKPRAPRGKIVAVSGVIDVGFRSFKYDNPQTAMLNNVDEGGQVIAGPMLELWPGNLAGVRPLRNLALVVRMQFPLNKQPVEGGAIMGTTTTFWQSLEISARQRWTFSKGSVDIGAGFIRDQHQFNVSETSDIDLVPDADYRAIRIGARGGLRVGPIEPYLGVENRVVLSGGRIEERFTRGGSASGLRAALGANAKLGPLQTRLEGSFTRYSWTFKYDNNDDFRADGARDSIFLISAGIGYAY